MRKRSGKKSHGWMIQRSIDAVPALAEIQKNDRIMWNAAVAVDNELKDDPFFQFADYISRFKAVARVLGLQVKNRPTWEKMRRLRDDDYYSALLSAQLCDVMGDDLAGRRRRVAPARKRFRENFGKISGKNPLMTR